MASYRLYTWTISYIILNHCFGIFHPGDNYVRSMLPEATRNKGNMPSEAEANAFFSEVLGRKTFNPISKPEPIPGGYIIRGENKMKSYDALVTALEKELEKSSVSGKIQPFVIRDPTIVTDEQLESNTYEEAVVMITGTNLSPSTNRLVKPLVTLLGGLCIASFSVAVCIASDVASNNENIDTVMIEQMASPLLISILLTQVVHEAAHQIVAFKDKVSHFCSSKHTIFCMHVSILNNVL